ncbi:MAG: HDOD domain-containing protein [Desulfobacterales bacterium]|nr:HDOD domain-containing protein [Desulfobacterales bacterium]
MKKTIYRIVANNISPDQLGPFTQILVSDLNFSQNKAEQFNKNLPRILYENSDRSKVKKVLNSLKPVNAKFSVQKLIREESLSIYIQNTQQRLISKILNMALRAGTDTAIVHLIVEPETESELLPSLIARGEEIENLFRLSDFVYVLDDNSLLFLGFGTDKDGLNFLIPKLVKAVKNIVGKDSNIKFGEAVFPKDGYTLPDLLRTINKNFDTDQEQDQPIAEPVKEQLSDGNDILKIQLDDEPTAVFDAGTYIKDARGTFYHKLCSLPPETVWCGVKSMEVKDQKRFVLRLPYNSVLINYLFGKIKKQADVKDLETAQKQINSLVETMQIEKNLIERERNKTSVVAMLNRIESLPIIPSVAMQVYNLSINPESEIEDIRKVLATDQALALKILKLVNSPFYGLAQKVESIKEGVVILGMEEVAQLAFGLSLTNSFSGKGIKGIVDPVSLRRHAVETAITGLFLCKDLDEEKFKGAFTACVLHDIGKLFFIQNFPDLYKRVVMKAKAMQIPLYAAEEEVFGLNHGVVGGIIAKKWNLPNSLVQAISFHHYPSDAGEYQQLASIVGFADSLCHMEIINEDGQEINSLNGSLMNQSLIAVLKTVMETMSDQAIKETKEKAIQFLDENGTILSSIVSD